jgi:hypothetical protein
MEGQPVQIRQRKVGRGARPRRCRDLRLEFLEGRNLLSATGLVNLAPAEVRPAVQLVSTKGTINGVAALGQTTFDSLGDAIVPVSSTGSGYLSHLGPVTMTESHTTTILAASQYTTSLVTDGRATITDADGDQLFLAFGGAGVLTGPGQFDDTFVYTVTGGTGRFAGAVGGGVIQSTDEPGTATEVPFTFDLNGIVLTVG